ncbi:putative DNA-binding domain-containing protein [Haliea sp. E1-2-M8]|uniref:HvfC family RiPP maturation protein n=1 Tax=Haliea sp. E1-2-M8 TaxID=3064706 RepID=UPI00272127E7|nr:putative DNA-binding domain-containing protein [Haliea sp. E1-2-M8]MDO8861200.1 putative DNA-binding domain-containing protein [Haliea sp. E1-2-M8]
MAELRGSQLALAGYLRNPGSVPPPAGIEPRRLKIYQDLIYNNIEGFISNGFPVLRSLYSDRDWHILVRQFIDGHRCRTPYFLEISQEFLRFLLERHQPGPEDPPFIAELAHYEWVELALSVADGDLPPGSEEGDPLRVVVRLSPLAWVLAYRFPVHRIGADFRPPEPGEPVYLVVYRDREDVVRFMALNAASARLLELARDNETGTGADLLQQLAAELGMDREAVLGFGGAQLADFASRAVIVLN